MRIKCALGIKRNMGQLSQFPTDDLRLRRLIGNISEQMGIILPLSLLSCSQSETGETFSFLLIAAYFNILFRIHLTF